MTDVPFPARAKRPFYTSLLFQLLGVSLAFLLGLRFPASEPSLIGLAFLASVLFAWRTAKACDISPFWGLAVLLGVLGYICLWQAGSGKPRSALMVLALFVVAQLGVIGLVVWM